MKSCTKLLLIFLLVAPVVLAGNYATFTASDDIAAGDLSMEVEGEPVQIVDFFKVDTNGSDAPFLSHPAGRRQFVLLFDLIFHTPEQLVAARTSALKMLDAAGKDDLIAVAGIGNAGLKVFCAPTTDRNQIIAGLNALAREKLEGMITGPEGNFYPANFTRDVPVLRPYTDQEFIGTLKPLGLEQKKKEEHSFVMVQGLVDLTYALSAVHGRKIVLFFSPGFESKGVSLNLDLDQKRNAETGTRSAGAAEPQSLDSITNTVRDIEALAQQGPSARPRQTGVDVIPSIYSGVDARVYVVNLSENENGFLKDLSEKTNAVYQQAAFDPAAVLQPEEQFYVIEWQDTKRKEWKTLNTQKISAGDKKITAANKWMSPRPMDEQSALEKRMRLAEAVYKDFGKPAENDRYWADFAFEQGFSKITSFIQMSSADLLKNGKDTLRLEFYAYVMSREGAVLDAGSVPVELDLGNEKLRQRISDSGLKVWNVLLGKEAPLTIRSIIINSATGETKTNSLFLEVKETDLTMSMPFVPATDFSWIVWPKPDEELTRRGVDVSYPYHQGNDQLFFPDLSPVLKPESGVVYFRLYNLLPESRNPMVHFQLLDAKGQATDIDVFNLMQKPRNLEHSGMELFWSIKSLPAVEPGTYRIKVGIQDPLRKQTVVREIRHLSVRSS